MNDKDKIYLQDFKKKYIEGCQVCFGKNIRCSCQKKLQLEIKKVKAHIPLKYRDFTDYKIKKPEVISYLTNLQDNFKKGLGLFVYGGSNVDRIKLVSYILSQALEKNFSVQFINFGDTIALSTKSWYSEEVYFGEVVDLINVDFLAIDEVGSEYKKELATTVFDGIFRERCNKLNVTIMISSISWDDIGQYYGAKTKQLFEEHLIPVTYSGVFIKQNGA